MRVISSGELVLHASVLLALCIFHFDFDLIVLAIVAIVKLHAKQNGFDWRPHQNAPISEVTLCFRQSAFDTG